MAILLDELLWNQTQPFAAQRGPVAAGRMAHLQGRGVMQIKPRALRAFAPVNIFRQPRAKRACRFEHRAAGHQIGRDPKPFGANIGLVVKGKHPLEQLRPAAARGPRPGGLVKQPDFAAKDACMSAQIKRRGNPVRPCDAIAIQKRDPRRDRGLHARIARSACAGFRLRHHPRPRKLPRQRAQIRRRAIISHHHLHPRGHLPREALQTAAQPCMVIEMGDNHGKLGHWVNRPKFR